MDRVKFYSVNDCAVGYQLQKAEKIINEFDKNNVNITTLGDETSPKLSAMPTMIDSNDETFTICGALKWMIEYIYKLFPNTKIGFITPWAYQIRNDIDGSYILDRSRVDGGDFARAIRMICPLHGPILNKNLDYYIGKYLTWSSYGAEDEAGLIACASIHGNTKMAAEKLADILKEKGSSLLIETIEKEIIKCFLTAAA